MHEKLYNMKKELAGLLRSDRLLSVRGEGSEQDRHDKGFADSEKP